MYVVVVDVNGTVKENRYYNIYYCPGSSNGVKEFLSSNEVKPSDIVLITSWDTVHTYFYLARPGIQLLTCGTTISDMGSRETLTIIGRKAAPCPPWFFLKHEKRGKGPVIVTKTITTVY